LFRERHKRGTFFTKSIEVKESPVHGLGVFAIEDIPKNTCLEICPILKIDKALMQQWWDIEGERHVLLEYIFKSRKDGKHAIVWGYGSIYNHSYENSNALFRWSTDHKNCDAIEFWSTREIKKGEEIFTKYCKDKEDEWLWF